MKATQTRTDPRMHNYYWKKIGTLIEGWVTKNDSGYSTAWGMLEDRYFKVRGDILSAEIGGKDIDLSSAAERMGCAKELHGMACDLFIKQEGITDERKIGV
jgi:hypothetical protein